MAKPRTQSDDTLSHFRTLTRRLLPVPRSEVDERDRKWREARQERREVREARKAKKA